MKVFSVVSFKGLPSQAGDRSVPKYFPTQQKHPDSLRNTPKKTLLSRFGPLLSSLALLGGSFVYGPSVISTISKEFKQLEENHQELSRQQENIEKRTEKITNRLKNTSQRVERLQSDTNSLRKDLED